MELREIINKYGLYLREDGNIGIRRKPKNIEELKKLKPQLIQELKKIEEEKRIASDPREGKLRLSYYYGDWYRANAIFKTEEFGGNQPEWGNFSNIFNNMELNKITGDWFESTQMAYVDEQNLVKVLEKLFNCDTSTTKEALQKRFPDLEIVMQTYDDLRGKGEYVGDIIFPNFEIFEKYVQEAFSDHIEKAKVKKEKIDSIFMKAKEIGEKQLIQEYHVDCNSRDEDCNFDIISEYAMPDGTRHIERIHTY